jgi:RNA methyltransferase, TrmH family
MKIIISLTNPEVKTVVSLHMPKYRKTLNQFIAEGLRTCKTLLEAGLEPDKIYATAAMFPDALEIAGNDRSITEVTPEVMEKMSTATAPSGILMVFPIPVPPTLATLTPGLVLAQIFDPGNMGTLMRTAAAMNVKTVVCIEGSDCWSPKVVQASAGTIGYLNIFQISWQTLLEHKQNLQLCALVVKDGMHPDQLDLTNSLLVVGSEAHGIPEEWILACDQKLTLPMPGHAESLNAAVAGSIALYTAFGK